MLCCCSACILLTVTTRHVGITSTTTSSASTTRKRCAIACTASTCYDLDCSVLLACCLNNRRLLAKVPITVHTLVVYRSPEGMQSLYTHGRGAKPSVMDTVDMVGQLLCCQQHQNLAMSRVSGFHGDEVQPLVHNMGGHRAV